jgi:hypothetical protein
MRQNTLALDGSEEEYPCFVVSDLSKDPRFANLPVVDGQMASYRFYAGAPITTSHGVSIGSLFFFDNKPRDGLAPGQRRFMHTQAGNIIKHLETKREAAERRRVALMSKGIARFLERTSRDNYLGNDEGHLPEDEEEPSEDVDARGDVQIQTETENGMRAGHSSPAPVATESVVDKIKTALDHAADILRESLELRSGGVVFLDPAIGYVENDNINISAGPTADIVAKEERPHRDEKARQGSNGSQLRPSISQDSQPGARHLSIAATRSSTDKHKASKILALSSGSTATSCFRSTALDAKTLQSLIKSYPQGNIWYMDDKGYLSCLEPLNEWEQRNGTNPSGSIRSTSPINVTKKQAEIAILSRIFQDARQIIFLPLWDAGGGTNSF